MLTISQEEIIRNWKRKDLKKPLVSIRCTAYNHEEYISQALDGFLMQKTDFPFEVIVHDDASTDNTARIIKCYEERFPLIIKPIYEKENQYSKRDDSLTKIIDAHIKGKYIAFCEGDDYWIDELKLQKQIDFLENNPEYEMCFTNFNIFYQERNLFKYDLLISESVRFRSDYSIQEWIFHLGYTAPMTWVYKRTLLDNYQKLPSCDGTFVMFAHFLASTKVKCLKNDTTAVYRVLSESASHSKDPKRIFKRNKNLSEVQKMLIDRYNLSSDLKIEVTKQFYKRSYKLIGLINDYNEIQEAKKYCTSFECKFYFLLMSILPVRKLVYIWWANR